MNLEQVASMWGSGAMHLRQLRGIQPPAGHLSSDDLASRAASAADLFRGYISALVDLGRITNDQFAAIWSEINDAESWRFID